MVFYPHSEHFWQIKEGLLPEKGQDYAENQPDGKDDGVDAIVSVTVPNHLFNICTSGETLCRDNCQLIVMPFFHTRSAGKNNRN